MKDEEIETAVQKKRSYWNMFGSKVIVYLKQERKLAIRQPSEDKSS